jgi:nickel-dependent lactate racemase
MPNVTIPYGKERVELHIPDANFMGYYPPNSVTYPDDEVTLLTQAIDHPIGSLPLGEIVKPGQKVAIICDDITRPTPAYKIAPLLLERLLAAGVVADDIFFVLALGSHRDMTPAEIERKLGSEIPARYRITNSRFRDEAGLVDLGMAPGGVHVWADKNAMSADIRIGIGSIVPHPAVGWSGGGKIIYPGVAGENTVAQFHLQHGKAGWNMFGADECPVRQNMEAWVDTVGLHFIVNIVGSPDGRIYRAVAGDYVKAQRAGVAYAKEVYGVHVPERADVVIASSYPSDDDFWQASKAILPGDLLAKDGGTVIIVTPCPEGVGPHPRYMEYIGNTDVDALLRQAEAGGDHDLVALPVAATVARIQHRIRLVIVSTGLQATDAHLAGMDHYPSLELALQDALRRAGANAQVAVLPYGAEIVPLVP